MVYHPGACPHHAFHDALSGQLKKQCQAVMLTVAALGQLSSEGRKKKMYPVFIVPSCQESRAQSSS